MNKEARLAPVDYEGSFAGKAARNAFIVVVLTFLSVYFGSEQFAYVDLALSGYLAATVLCFVLLTMRITAWTLRPPTRRLWKQGLEMMASRRGQKFLWSTLFSNIGAQKFISKRSMYRWAAHFTLSWGVLLSFGITFALVLNWMHFELVDPATYSVVVFGIPLFRMGVNSFLAIMLYHGLNWTGILVIVGCVMAMIRRVKDKKLLVEQSHEYDIFPLVLLIAISITGSLLTVSALWMEGAFYLGIGLAHQITVIVFLLYIPFSKFWHLPLRFLAVVVPMYHALNEQKPCARCGRLYATKAQIQDVQDALRRRSIPFPITGTGMHYSDMCSECRRTANRLAAYGAKVGFETNGSIVGNNGRNGMTLIQEGEGFHARPEH